MLQLLLILATTWAVVCFIDVIFKTCMLFPYIHALEMSGITIKPCYFQMCITCLNRRFIRWGNYRPYLLRKWFDIGTIITCTVMIPAIGLLLISAINMFFVTEHVQLESQLLQPVVPGLNLPFSQIIYYLLTLFLCFVFHELGHALAAVREGIQIEGCGFFIIGIMPGAFVHLQINQVMYLSPWQQLRIFSAGIWHNIVLALFSLLLLASNSIVLFPVFQQNAGVTVIDVVQESGAAGPAGLHSGDEIHFVENCVVTNIESWKLCLKEIALKFQHGYCVSKSFILEEKIEFDNEIRGLKDCCGNSSSRICFNYLDAATQEHSFACLPARKLLRAAMFCNNSMECGNIDLNVCVAPVLGSVTDRLIQVGRRKKDFVLYFGSTAELFSSVTFSPWISKVKFASVYFIHIYETLLKYLISFSGALALLNLIPCFGLDGQWLCQILVDWLFSTTIPKKSQRDVMILGLKIFGCSLITVNIILGLYKLLNVV